MKLTKQTIDAIQSFIGINNALILPKESDTLCVVSPSRTVIAKTKIDCEFPSTFRLSDASRFIKFATLEDGDVELKFKESADGKAVKATLKFPSGGTGIYHSAGERIVADHPDTIDYDREDITFDITESIVNQVNKAAVVLGVRNISMIGDGEHIYIQVSDIDNKDGDTLKIKVGESDKKFTAIFMTTNFQIIPDNYEVVLDLGDKYLAHFKGVNTEYYIALENESTIE